MIGRGAPDEPVSSQQSPRRPGDRSQDRGRGYVGVKIVSVFPGNAERGRPSVSGVYLLMSGQSGEPLALIDGQALTLWRTAAASALAATYLARHDSSRLLMVGAGALAPYLIAAHAAVRPIREVLIWNRHGERAEKLAARLAGRRYSAAATTDLEGAVRGAEGVAHVYLFGSVARDEAAEDSDVDLFIIAPSKERFFQRMATVRRLIRDLRNGLPVAPIVLTAKELEKRQEARDPFIEEVLSTGIPL